MAKVKVMKRAESEKTLAELFEDFQLENRVKNLSDMTIRFYEQNLVHTFRFMDEIGIDFVKDIEKRHVDKFILWLKKKGLKATTINTYMRATRSFLYFAMRENYLLQFEINLIKADNEQKEPYSEEEIRKLIKKPNIKECGFVEQRNWVIVNYLLETGNRLNTVLNIKVQDIDFDNGMVILTTTKNRKAQYNPISEQLIKVLTEFIRMYRMKKDDYLFMNELGEQLTRNSLQHSIARFNKKRGVEKTSIHAFRHTFAKHYITSGGDAFKLQRLLGHSTLDVTLNYVNLYSEDLKKDFNKHSILANFTENTRMKRGRKSF
jgi:integrase/recombinase XerD